MRVVILFAQSSGNVFKYLDYQIFIVIAWLLLICKCYANSIQCQKSRHYFESQKIDISLNNFKSNSGKLLQFCNSEYTCCSQEFEKKLILHAVQENEKSIYESLQLIYNIFSSKSTAFNGFFQALLQNSKKDFHNTYKLTYGILYEKNAYIFHNLFNHLENYYNYGSVDLTEKMKEFFSILLQKMFTVFNSQYRFNDSYLTCVRQSIDHLKPFGDVPQLLTIQVRRSFVAARTFLYGLQAGRNVISQLLKVKISRDCGKNLMIMKYCSACNGNPELQVCDKLCQKVMKTCFPYIYDIPDYWHPFIDSFLYLAERLEGPFNIESVIDPIDIKISDAIMNFQESGPEITQKVFSECGQPRLQKRNSHTNNEEMLSPLSHYSDSYNDTNRYSLEKVKDAKKCFINLSSKLCNNAVSYAPCWNGSNLTKFPGLHERERKFDANEKINSELQDVTIKLQNAHNGFDVIWDQKSIYEIVNSDEGSGNGNYFDNSDLEGSGQNEVIHSSVKNFNNDVDFVFVAPIEKTDDENIHHTPKYPQIGFYRALFVYLLPTFTKWIENIQL